MRSGLNKTCLERGGRLRWDDQQQCWNNRLPQGCAKSLNESRATVPSGRKQIDALR